MVYCNKCGKELNSQDKFCPECGTYLVPDSPEKKDADGIIDRAFGKALASAICAGLPIASIVAIVLGCKALKEWKCAKALEAQFGFRLTGKHIPTRVLALVGKFAGIFGVVFWTLYFAIIIGVCVAAFSFGA